VTGSLCAARDSNPEPARRPGRGQRPAHRVPGHPQPPHDRLDRQALSPMQPADLRPILHSQHNPQNQRGGSIFNRRHGVIVQSAATWLFLPVRGASTVRQLGGSDSRVAERPVALTRRGSHDEADPPLVDHCIGSGLVGVRNHGCRGGRWRCTVDGRDFRCCCGWRGHGTDTDGADDQAA